MDIEDKCDFLYEYSAHEGSEAGEVWYSLALLLESPAFEYGSDEFQKAVLKEVDETIEFIKTNFKLVTQEYSKKEICTETYLEFIG